MAYPKYPFDPSSTTQLDYTVSWADWLATGDTVESAVWICSAGIEESTDPAKSNTTTTCTVFVKPTALIGAAGTTETLTCRVTTVGGRTDDRSMTLKVREG